MNYPETMQVLRDKANLRSLRAMSGEMPTPVLASKLRHLAQEVELALIEQDRKLWEQDRQSQ